MMRERVKFQDFNVLWRTHVCRNESLRMTDDQAERDFWRAFMGRKAGYCPDGSSRQVVADVLLPLLQKYDIRTALEWGPGWGNYTIDLAKACQSVDCVDISQDVLTFIQRAGTEQGCGNIRTFAAKWEDFTPQRTYDLVFGYNCFYRQKDLADCFSRMDRTAEKLCIAGMNSSLAPAWIHAFAQAGAEVRWEWKDYIYFIGVLYQMGIDPQVAVLPFTKVVQYPDEAAMLEGERSRCVPGTIDDKTALQILRRHLVRQPDGQFRAEVPCHSGIVWWIPTGRQLL